ncbi:MAG: ferrochelatase [Aquabacterium sp.]|nr:MAG: ferrochelatase [Aquabacterium sp.]
MSVRKETEPRQGEAGRTGILLVNLGTPDEPTPAAVRRYLAEFLGDPRVVEIPALLWKPILHGVILRTRPKESAKKYASIWTPEGSPLRVWTDRQTKLLAGYLGERGQQLPVRYGMRYGNPSIAEGMEALLAAGARRVLVLPLYPQYCAATTATALDKLGDWIRATRHVPEIRTVTSFADDEGYLAALAARIQAHWRTHGREGKLVMSFHGMPRRTADLGDPYQRECLQTGHLLARRLDLREDEWVLTFQSRFGRAEWLQPYTEPTLRELARGGTKRVDVVCPGFVADCVETLEEIAMEGKQAFLSSGGKEFNYIPCLNADHAWITALAALVQRHLQGWPVAPVDNDRGGPRDPALQAVFRP